MPKCFYCRLPLDLCICQREIEDDPDAAENDVRIEMIEGKPVRTAFVHPISSDQRVWDSFIR